MSNNALINITPETKNEIIKGDDTQLTIFYYLGEKAIKEYMELARQELINRKVSSVEFINPVNMKKFRLLITPGQETTKVEISKSVNYDKAIEFAKQHNFEIPMTTPQVDYCRIESMDGFQNHISDMKDFGVFEERNVERKVKSNTTFRYTEVK